MPAAAFGGRADVMAHIAPDGPVYQAGTLSGNPLAMAAGLATLEIIEAPGFFTALEEQTRKLCVGLAQSAEDAGIPLCVDYQGGMFGFVFCAKERVDRFDQVAAADIGRFRKFFHGMLGAGIYLAPSAFEAGFVSSAHGDAEISQTLEAAASVFATL